MAPERICRSVDLPEPFGPISPIRSPSETVKATFRVDLPRPRVVQEIRFDPRFVELYQQIWEALRDEVQIAYARTTTATVAGAVAS